MVPNTGRLSSLSEQNPESIEALAETLELEPGELGLSMFEVVDEDHAKRLAAMWALSVLNNPDTIGYLYWSQEAIEELGLNLVPTENRRLPAELSRQHREGVGADQAAARTELVRAALLRDGCRVGRVTQGQVKRRGAAFLERGELDRASVGEKWLKKIDRLRL